MGSLFTQGNAERLAALFDYGVRDRQISPDMLISVSPQVKHWGATTQLRDTLALLKAKVEALPRAEEDAGMATHCLVAGRPSRYLERMFDQVHQAEHVRFPPPLEILLVPNTIVALSVHSLVGASTGLAAPLGLGSFDGEIVRRVQRYILDNLDACVSNNEARTAIKDRCSMEAVDELESGPD